ncbi:MAG TPA: DUF692 family protein [bacterium]|nr:DUF692 family protein [bacterium]
MSTTKQPMFPRLGSGVGLRPKHYAQVLGDPELATRSAWFEVISENFMIDGGKPLDVLFQVRETHPIVLHGVSLSIGSADPLNEKYLRALKALVERVKPAMVSDHLCWGSIDGAYAHDLLPLPYSEDEIPRIADRIKRVQDVLGRRFMIENVSSYLTYRHSTMPEWEFLAAVVEKADCGILLDINNIYVSSKNHRFDPKTYVDAIPVERVGQFHLAGHSTYPSYLLDTHDGPVIDPVWDLYKHAVRRFGDVSSLIEWDDKLPDFARLVEEAETAKKFAAAETRAAEQRAVAHATSGGAKPAFTTQQTQRYFWQFITAPTGAAGAKDADKIDTLFVGDELAAATRIDIYASMYFARLHDCLLEDYPALEKSVGHVHFHNLVTDFLLVHPSGNPSLRHLGAPLPAFLRTHKLLQTHPWAADLAALEWARVEAFDSANGTPLEISALASIAPDKWAGLSFDVHPSARVVRSEWRVAPTWKAVDDDEAEIPVPPHEPSAYRVWREEHTVFHVSMEPLEAECFEALLRGESFGAMCGIAANALGGDPEAAAAQVVALLRGWLDDKLLVGVRLPLPQRKPAAL